MARLDITRKIKLRSRLRIGTFFASLALIVIMVQVMIVGNAHDSKAVNYCPVEAGLPVCRITSSGTITGPKNSGGDEQSFVSDGGSTFKIRPYDNVKISNGAKVVLSPVVNNEGYSAIMASLEVSGAGTSLAADMPIKVNGDVTVSYNAVITSSVLTLADFVPIPQTNQYPLTWTGSLKGVNMKISGQLSLTSGGQINVDGKGYPGGKCRNDGLQQQDVDTPDQLFLASFVGTGSNGEGYTFPFVGSGFGGSPAVSSGDQFSYSSGAGYGGQGGSSGGSFNVAGGVSHGANNPLSAWPDKSNFYFGSGAGVSNSTSHDCKNGGYGGGRIYIDAKNISIDATTSSAISANGGQGTAGSQVASGGGSGGTIIIIDHTQSSATTLISSVRSSWPSDTDHFGTICYDGILNSACPAPYNPLNDANNVNVLARGGAGGGNHADAERNGGGGRIVIKYTPEVALPRTISFSKKLIASYRPVVGIDPSFNPYGLRSGDYIIVDITIDPFGETGSVTLSDSILKTTTDSRVSMIKKCQIKAQASQTSQNVDGVADLPASGTGITPISSIADDPQIYSVEPSSVSRQLYYMCRVD